MGSKMLSVVGARPNFMKIAAICEAIKEHNRHGEGSFIDHVLVHTGQHYDANMSDFFFNDLELPKPDLFLGVGSGSHSAQTAKVMERFEAVLTAEKPDCVVVVGDVNSTMACALATKKTACREIASGKVSIPSLAHIEAGLRSFDRSMPEEINRIVTDSISDYLFTTEESANINLAREGVPTGRVYFVGNVMIDTLLRHRVKAQESTILSDLQLIDKGTVQPYAILTLHRPSNVDDPKVLEEIVKAFLTISQHMPVIFPAHPRTVKQIQEADLGDYFVDHWTNGPEPWDSRVRIRLVPPLGYIDFLQLMSHSKVVLTDSGGVQEETTILGIPCMTLRENTERPVTLEHGTNVLVGADREKIVLEFSRILNSPNPILATPPLWDGNAARRIIAILARHMGSSVADSVPLSSNANIAQRAQL